MKKQLEVEYNAKGARRKMFLQASDKVQANNLMKQRVGGTIVKRGETQVVANTGGDFKAQVSRMLGGSGRVRTLPLVASIRQLSVMTNAGISIHDSIKEVARAAEDKTLKEIFSAMNDDLNAGLSLTESTEKFRGQLGDVVVAMVSLGEATGNMAESLAKLAAMLQELWENQRKKKGDAISDDPYDRYGDCVFGFDDVCRAEIPRNFRRARRGFATTY